MSQILRYISRRRSRSIVPLLKRIFYKFLFLEQNSIELTGEGCVLVTGLISHFLDEDVDEIMGTLVIAVVPFVLVDQILLQ